jgi:hypothetical protein
MKIEKSQLRRNNSVCAGSLSPKASHCGPERSNLFRSIFTNTLKCFSKRQIHTLHRNYFNPYNLLFYALGQGSAVGVKTRWTVGGPNPGGSEIFLTRPDRPWGPPSLLYNGYRVSFLGAKRPGRGVNHIPHLAPRLKKE